MPVTVEAKHEPEQFLKDNILKVACPDKKWYDDDIEYVKWVGVVKEGRQPLTIVTLRQDDDKMRVFTGRSSLRPDNIRIGNDLTKKQRLKLNALRSQGQKTYYYKGELKFVDKSYTHQTKQSERVIKTAVRQTSNIPLNANLEANEHDTHNQEMDMDTIVITYAQPVPDKPDLTKWEEGCLSELKVIQLFPDWREILCLLFADDLALMADTVVCLQRILNKLSDFTQEFNLRVNTKKTKVMVYKNGGTLSKTENKERLEVVNGFPYIFDTKIAPILAYCSELWGTEKRNTIECVQIYACKRHMCVPQKKNKHSTSNEILA
ncbi:hypothetical protein MAR_003041 [Mya arenaria]|uniref:Reverse transcriptase domain-containing protein n=1 Tax=Mya arenaria TaxID=6604 RepID=A0ABY7G4W0_MYAAR|nr:hypothetical protein MAR_003041 [Mya arenaria]